MGVSNEASALRSSLPKKRKRMLNKMNLQRGAEEKTKVGKESAKSSNSKLSSKKAGKKTKRTANRVCRPGYAHMVRMR